MLAVGAWLLVGPRPRAGWSVAWTALAWPILWLVVILAQGAVTGWYPYPFLDVDAKGAGTVVAHLHRHHRPLPRDLGPRGLARPPDAARAGPRPRPPTRRPPSPRQNDGVPTPDAVLDPAIAARLKRDPAGLVAAVVQQHDTGEVLMLGWMDDEALRRTLTQGRVTYWSRSRGEYWRKGDTSGHVQHVRSVALDCDGDALLVRVDQVGAGLPHRRAHLLRRRRPRCGRERRVSTASASATTPDLAYGQTWPTLDVFGVLARDRRVIPVVRRLMGDAETPVGVYRKLAGDRPGTFLLESAEHGGVWSRWSIVGAASAATLTERDGQVHWVGEPPVGVPTTGLATEALRATMAALATEPIAGLPPLTGGMVGAITYDAVRRWERVPETAPDELELPELALMLATDLAVLDHTDGSILLVANAVNYDDTDERVELAWADAVARLDAMTRALAAPADEHRRRRRHRGRRRRHGDGALQHHP